MIFIDTWGFIAFVNKKETKHNEKILINFYKIMKERIQLTEGLLWKMLSKSELEELTSAIEESYHSQNLISNKEMINKHKQWL